MISIQKYLQQRLRTGSQGESDSQGESGSQGESSLDNVIRLLITGVEGLAVEGEPEEIARFQESTQIVVAALDANAPPVELLSHAAGAMQAMQVYQRHLVEYLRRPALELQEKVKSLTAAVTAIGGASSEGIGRLQQIKERILKSLNLKEIRDLRQLLSECLDGVMMEAERHRAESDRAAELLNGSRRRPAPREGDGESEARDLVDGLPGRVSAEEAIAQACQDEAPAFVVVIVINQLNTMSRNMGPEFSVEMVERYTAFLRQRLAPVDQLYRWSGAALVALVRRSKTLEAVRLELAHPLTQRLAMKFPGSGVLVPISARWTVMSLMASPRLLFRKLDSFADFK